LLALNTTAIFPVPAYAFVCCTVTALPVCKPNTISVHQVRSVLVVTTSVHLCKRVESIVEKGGVSRLDSVVQVQSS
jgi:hypothetical protein